MDYFKVAKICFAAVLINSSSVLSFLHQNSCCFSKLKACRLPSTIGNTLTTGYISKKPTLQKKLQINYNCIYLVTNCWALERGERGVVETKVIMPEKIVPYKCNTSKQLHSFTGPCLLAKWILQLPVLREVPGSHPSLLVTCCFDPWLFSVGSNQALHRTLHMCLNISMKMDLDIDVHFK